MFCLMPREERFFDLLEEEGRNAVEAVHRLREMIFDETMGIIIRLNPVGASAPRRPARSC